MPYEEPAKNLYMPGRERARTPARAASQGRVRLEGGAVSDTPLFTLDAEGRCLQRVSVDGHSIHGGLAVRRTKGWESILAQLRKFHPYSLRASNW